MADTWDDFGSLTGSAADYMGFGYQPFSGASTVAPTDTSGFSYTGGPAEYVSNAPIQGEYGSYQPSFNFDFSSFFPTTSFAPQTTGLYAEQAPTAFAGPTSQPSYESLQPLYQAAMQPLPASVRDFALPEAASIRSGLYDTRSVPGFETAAAPTAPTGAPQEKGFLQDLLGGLKTADILKLALGAGGAIMGSQAQQRAIDDAARARAEYEKAYKGAGKEFKSLAAPVLTPGYTQLSQAVQGAFSPASMQQFQAAQAQLAQGASSAGGMGAVQSAEALNRIRNQILESQTKTALALIGAGEPMAVNAINADLQGTTGGLKMELDMSQMANEASMRMYQSIASAIGSGFGSGAQYAQSRVA